MKPLTKALLKKISSLRIPKYRKKHNLFIAEGEKLLEEALHAKEEIEYIVVNEDKKSEFETVFLNKVNPEKVYIVEDSQFHKISDLETPSGILFVVRTRETDSLESLRRLKKPIIIMDHIQDPGNAGTILRTAHWFGIDNIVISPDCADRYNPKVIRASMGAVFYQKFYRYDDTQTFFSFLENTGFFPVVAALGGNPIHEIPGNITQWALVVGNEARGVDPEWLKNRKYIFSIPGFSQFDSLNVAVSAGIFMYHLSQKNQEK